MDLHVDPSRWDNLRGAEREQAVGHLVRCAACRTRLLASDPTRAFALLGAEAIPVAALRRLDERVDEALSAARRGARPTGARWLSLAASLALAAWIGAWVAGRPGPAVEPAAEIAAAAGNGLRFEAQSDAGSLSEGIRGFRLVGAGPDAQVLDLTVGETQVVMIFDGKLEI